MKKGLIGDISREKVKSVAIIGLAKNAGKTVTFNTIVEEAAQEGISLGLLSYGRDGELVDSVTLQEKPKIFIPPGTLFVTAQRALEKGSVPAEKVLETGYFSVMGEVNVYRALDRGGYAELVGINSTSRLQRIKDYLQGRVDLMLVDGALDRRSSAVPTLTDGVIVATGAVLGNTEDFVIFRTVNELQKLTLPQVTDSRLKEMAREAMEAASITIIKRSGELEKVKGLSTFQAQEKIFKNRYMLNDASAIIFSGALIDSFLEKAVFPEMVRDCKILVRDGTRVFLNWRNMNLLKEYNLQLLVINPVQVLGVTVNPTSPYSAPLDSQKLVLGLKKALVRLPVYDLKGEGYQAKRGAFVGGKN